MPIYSHIYEKVNLIVKHVIDSLQCAIAHALSNRAGFLKTGTVYQYQRCSTWNRG